MKVRELIRQCNLKANDEVSDDYWVDRFNEALADLAPVLQLEGIKITELPALIPIRLPKDVLYDRIILCSLGAPNQNIPRIALDNFTSRGFKVFDNSIELQGSYTLPNTLRIWYQRLPEILTVDNLDTEPEMPEAFQHALKYYAIAKWWQTELEPDFEASYWRDYMDIKQQLAYFTNRKSRRYHDLRFRIE